MIESLPCRTASIVSSPPENPFCLTIGLQIVVLFYISVGLILSDAFLLWSNRQLYPASAVRNGKDISLSLICVRPGVSSTGKDSPHHLSFKDDRRRLPFRRAFVGLFYRHGHGVSGLL